MRRLLEFCEDQDAVWWHGALWALGMAGSELIRVLFFGMMWGVAYRYCVTSKLIFGIHLMFHFFQDWGSIKISSHCDALQKNYATFNLRQ